MKKALFYPLAGIVSSILVIVNFVLFILLSFIAGVLAHLVPYKPWRRKVVSWAMNVPALWYRSSYLLLRLNVSISWDISIKDTYNKHGWYILMCNHLSWLDIPVVAGVFSFKVSAIKFFMKEELVWLMPLGGLACKLLGFPMLSRGNKNIRSGTKDMDVIANACEDVKPYPTSLFMFIEGTRFSEQKCSKQKSPFRYLLKPKMGGFATVLNSMHNQLDGILDVTINYEPRQFSFINFILGRVKKVTIRSRVIPIDPNLLGDFKKDANYKTQLRTWLDQQWQLKDSQLAAMNKDD